MPDFHSSQQALPSIHDVPISSTALCASRICLQALALASTSRFIPQRPFTLYKGVVALFFLFWCVRWPLADFDAIFLFVTYWAWYTGALCEYVQSTSEVPGMRTRSFCMPVHSPYQHASTRVVWHIVPFSIAHGPTICVFNLDTSCDTAVLVDVLVRVVSAHNIFGLSRISVTERPS